MWKESDIEQYNKKISKTGLPFCPICRTQVASIESCQNTDETCAEKWIQALQHIDNPGKILTISGIHAYTIEANVRNTEPDGKFFKTYGAHLNDDLTYRGRVALGAIESCLQHAKTLPSCNPTTLISICFPEFFFRGFRYGYYPVSPENGDPNAGFEGRSRFANAFTAQLQDTFNQIIDKIWPESERAQPPPIAVCVGSITVGTGVVETRPLLPMQKPSSMMIIDNFSILLTCSMGENGQRISTGNIIYKRNPSHIDFLSFDGRSKGPLVCVPDHPAQTVLAVNSFGSSTRFGRMTSFPYPDAYLPPIVILPYTTTPWKHTPTSSSAPHPSALQSEGLPARIPAFTIGVSTCLDYAEETAAFYRAKRDQFHRDLIFVPSSGITVAEFDKVREGIDCAAIIHSDGGQLDSSNVALVTNGEVTLCSPTFSFGMTTAAQEMRSLGELDADKMYSWSPTRPVFWTYRGFLSYHALPSKPGSPTTPSAPSFGLTPMDL